MPKAQSLQGPPPGLAVGRMRRGPSQANSRHLAPHFRLRISPQSYHSLFSPRACSVHPPNSSGLFATTTAPPTLALWSHPVLWLAGAWEEEHRPKEGEGRTGKRLSRIGLQCSPFLGGVPTVTFHDPPLPANQPCRGSPISEPGLKSNLQSHVAGSRDKGSPTSGWEDPGLEWGDGGWRPGATEQRSV